MSIGDVPQSHWAPWFRKHDKPGNPLIPQAPTIFYPRNLVDLITICRDHPPNMRLHAAGSHWALSEAAVSDSGFIETHDWNEIFPTMGRTLYDVVPNCLTDDFLAELNEIPPSPISKSAPFYLVHIESGKRIYQLYAELDVGEGQLPGSLADVMKQRFGNDLFDGSWGFPTLGGAGGQTVVGALSTGTHGGDFDRPPVADSVVALHVVVDGGKHYWIEPALFERTPFVDEAKLRAFYGQPQFGGPDNFDVLYDTQVFRAALVQVGRFGAVYSAVLKVLPQYGLYQTVRFDHWENVRSLIADPNSSLFVERYDSKSQQKIPQQFLQIGVCPVPILDGTAHQCSVTKRWTVPLGDVPDSPPAITPVPWSSQGSLAGRPERVGAIVRANDSILNATRFANAGTSIPYSPDESGVTSFNAFEFACQDPNFLDGIVRAIFIEIENFLTTNAVPVGGAIAAVVAAGGGPGLIALASSLLAILAILALFLEALGAGGSTAGSALNDLRGALLGSPDPGQRLAGLIVWRAIANEAFKSLQPDPNKPFAALSYAVMDGHDYTDLSCNVNVRSTEVFFAADDPNLIAFVDRLLKFESDQEFGFPEGKSVAGYVSLRFSEQTAATIGPAQFIRTCAVECAGLADEAGSTEFVDYAVRLALDPNIKGILHWGQQNDSTRQDIEFRFGDAPGSPAGPLHDWRAVLGTLTDNGRLDAFSSTFTRRTGLEVGP
ncbi:MAG TPA: hypothetical protein VGG82_07285 [Casimicrobiaceae bacterium]|jgi:hypothetical protein